MAEPKAIYCPKCGRKVMTYDGRGSIPIDAGCKNCKKRVVYIPASNETKITPIPPRQGANYTRIWF